MKLKEVLTFNIGNSKIGKLAIGIFLILIAVVVIAGQFSIESRCERKVMGKLEQLPNELTVSSSVLKSIQKQEIEKCVKESKQL